VSDDQTAPSGFPPIPPASSPSAPPSFEPILPPPTPIPVTPVAKPSRGARGGTALNGLLIVASLVAVGGIAFGIGRATAASTTAATTGRFGNGQGQLGAGNGGGANPGGSFLPGRGQFGQGGFGGFGAAIALQGTVVSVTPETLTLKTTSGQTVQVPLATSTTYGTETASDAAAVTTGANVVVQLQGGGRGAFGGNGGNGPGASPAPGSSAAPGGGRGFNLGPAVSVTVVP
jgi:hypothetical protein